jgi:hypothetical protein
LWIISYILSLSVFAFGGVWGRCNPLARLRWQKKKIARPVGR